MLHGTVRIRRYREFGDAVGSWELLVAGGSHEQRRSGAVQRSRGGGFALCSARVRSAAALGEEESAAARPPVQLHDVGSRDDPGLLVCASHRSARQLFKLRLMTVQVMLIN
jgi:hypothetical protein